MDAFWTAARKMLRYRRMLIIALCCAVVSGSSLGGGIMAATPVIQAIVGKQQTLADLAHKFNATSPIDIPESVIAGFPTKPFKAVIVVMIGLSILTVIGATANFIHLYLSMTVVERTIARIRRDLFRRVIHLPLRSIVTSGSADPASRIFNDPQQLGVGLAAMISKGVSQVSKGIASFIAAFLIDWRLTGITVLVAPVLYAIIRSLSKRIRRASRAALEHQSLLLGAINESLQGLRVVKVHTTERYETGRFHKINKLVLGHILTARRARALSSPLIEAVAIVTVAGLSLIAVKAVFDQELDPEDMILALGALGIAGASLRPLTGIINDIHTSAAAAERIEQMLAEPVEPGHDRALPKLARHKKSIRFEHVTFTYPGGDRPAVVDLTLDIPHGETLAVVGPNGSGKTTLLSLVPRLFDPDGIKTHGDESQGVVRVDEVDIRTASIRSLRRQIGVVTQETVLFGGTIAQNIAYGAEGATMERIVAAAKKARAHEFIEAKGGYDCVVGERGLTLSGGQRQRIAIARAILRDPAILILDEATSMIDADSEAQITAALAEFSAGRTTLVVAHRLSTVINADRIAVLDKGKLVDSGTHAALLDRCAVYRQIAERQLIPASV
ncbi:MAG: ABC transporter ATP-binding protein [Phycisphaeraceae bacterium]|nr:MAG: ABC transporter ATP-binding protein [Phycisphaeraceae bacterium]